MRKTFVIFLSLFVLQQGLAQVTFNTNYNSLPLQEVLIDLETKCKVTFSYTSDIVDNILVTLDTKNQTLTEVLDEILSAHRLQSEVLGNDYIVITKTEALETMLCATLSNSIGDPLPFANIFIPSLQLGSNSDEFGKLNWTPKVFGDERIEISYLGYKTYQSSVAQLKSCPSIVLSQQEYFFEEVLVKEYVTTGIEQAPELNHMVLRPNKINMVPGLTDADVLHMVQLLPGIRSIDESATGMHVRGGAPDQNLILYDGIPIYNGGHFFGMISGFNPALVKKVNVYRGGFGSSYGGRVSSVIDIESINSIPERIKFDAGVNFTHGDLSLAVPLINSKLGLIVGGRKSYTNIVETPTYRELSERVFNKGKIDEVKGEEEPEVLDFALGFDFNDYNGKLLWVANSKDQISVSYFRSGDKLNFDYIDQYDNFETNDKLDQQSYGLNAKWLRKWRSNYSSTLSFSNSEQTNKYVFSISDDGSEDSELEESNLNDISDKTINFNNEWVVNKNWKLDFGTQYANLAVLRNFQAVDENAELEKDKNHIATGYLTMNTALMEKLNINIGLRYNHMFSTNEHFYEPRIALQYFPYNDFQIRANAGYYNQFMSQVIEFNDLGLNQNFWVLADEEEDISVVTSKNLALGMIYYPKLFMLEIEGYYKEQSGLTSNLSSFEMESLEDFDTGTGTSWGVDLLIKKRWNNWQSWLSYSYSRTKYTVELDQEVLSFNAPYDVPHSFRLTSQYKTNKWNLSLNWSLSSGIPYTPAVGLDDEDEAEPLYNNADINAQRLPLTHRLDLSIMYQVFHKNGWTAKLGFSILNIYNNENIMGREYFSVFEDALDEYELHTRDRSMLRLTPNLVFRIGFE